MCANEKVDLKKKKYFQKVTTTMNKKLGMQKWWKMLMAFFWCVLFHFERMHSLTTSNIHEYRRGNSQSLMSDKPFFTFHICIIRVSHVLISPTTKKCQVPVRVGENFIINLGFWHSLRYFFHFHSSKWNYWLEYLMKCSDCNK
jgi:hypothetical protein